MQGNCLWGGGRRCSVPNVLLTKTYAKLNQLSSLLPTTFAHSHHRSSLMGEMVCRSSTSRAMNLSALIQYSLQQDGGRRMPVGFQARTEKNYLQFAERGYSRQEGCLPEVRRKSCKRRRISCKSTSHLPSVERFICRRLVRRCLDFHCFCLYRYIYVPVLPR